MKEETGENQHHEQYLARRIRYLQVDRVVRTRVEEVQNAHRKEHQQRAANAHAIFELATGQQCNETYDGLVSYDANKLVPEETPLVSIVQHAQKADGALALKHSRLPGCDYCRGQDRQNCN